MCRGNGNTGGLIKIKASDLSRRIPDRCEEHPVAPAFGAKVSLTLPSSRFIGMPAIDPDDQCPEHLVVYMAEGLLRHDLSEIIGPAPQLAVELPDQVFRFGRDVGLDDFSNSFEEAFDRTLGGLDE